MPLHPSSAHAGSTDFAHPDLRLSLLQKWLSTLVATPTLIETLRPASANASFRRYFRVETPARQTLIVRDVPPDQEDTRPFLHVATVFGKTGVSLPAVLAQDVEQGFLLLSDLGTTTYLHQLDQNTAHQLYLDAIDALLRLQTQSQADVLPACDRALLARELQLFPDWYVARHLNVALTDDQKNTLAQVFDTLLTNNLAQAQVYAHRDYHSRKLMVLSSGNPGLLGFQGAAYGPITYDLVSLLRDAHIQWEEEMVLDWAIRYWERARRAGLPVAPDIDTFYRDFEWMGLQRHLKTLGLFARLYHRDGKNTYLKDLPRVMQYVVQVAHRYTALTPLARLMGQLEKDQAPQVGYTF